MKLHPVHITFYRYDNLKFQVSLKMHIRFKNKTKQENKQTCLQHYISTGMENMCILTGLLRPKQYAFLWRKVCILFQPSLKFVPEDPIDNNLTNGLGLNICQAISWSSKNPVPRHIKCWRYYSLALRQWYRCITRLQCVNLLWHDDSIRHHKSWLT